MQAVGVQSFAGTDRQINMAGLLAVRSTQAVDDVIPRFQGLGETPIGIQYRIGAAIIILVDHAHILQFGDVAELQMIGRIEQSLVPNDRQQ